MAAIAGSKGVISRWRASYTACASEHGIPRVTSLAITSAAFTAFTTASGCKPLRRSAPGSSCNNARTAEASNTGLLTFPGFTRCLRPSLGDQLVRQAYTFGDVFPHEGPRPAQPLLPRFHDQGALFRYDHAKLGGWVHSLF